MGQNKTIVITGGGTAGHITPNIPLIKEFVAQHWNVHCIILDNDFERRLLDFPEIKFHKISAGKLRRYFDFKNFLDALIIIKAIFHSYVLIKKIKPNIIFSKGGYIAFPVVLSGWLNRIPVIIHESDSTPSLTTKMCILFARLVCKGFDETKGWEFPLLFKKTVYTGIPLRDDILQVKHLKYADGHKLRIFIMGGSLGAVIINKVVRNNILVLTKYFEIYHVCGKNKIGKAYKNVSGYHQYGFVHKEITKLLSKIDLVVCRGGATTLQEMLYLKIPMLVIPLVKRVSRGEQIANAIYFANKGVAEVLFEEKLSCKTLLDKLFYMQKNINKYKHNMQKSKLPDSTMKIIRLIRSNSN